MFDMWPQTCLTNLFLSFLSHMTTDITDYHDLLRFEDEEDETPQGATPHRVYSEEEHKVIDKYREKYMAATSPTERKTIAELEMFPELFNYWRESGLIFNKKETLVKTKVN